MQIQENISLKNYNTFNVDVTAKRFVSITSYSELEALIKQESNFFVLSGGSNILFTKDLNCLVVHINIKGITIVKETDSSIEVKVNAGENWHEFVLWCLQNDYGGLENLSLIPGNVGTSPIQNIGAYGVEVKDRITQVETIEISSGKKVMLLNEECQFGYRNSIFKHQLKGKNIVTAVSFLLTKKNHKLNTSYGAIEAKLSEMGVANPTVQTISEAVVAIRSSKLPDPNKIGNGGSFFKNPIVKQTSLLQLQKKYPDIPHYTISEKEVKIPAGWLIEKAGFKGKKIGDAGVHKNQALVLVNYGNATGSDIYNLACQIQNHIQSQFGILLEMEVNIV